MAASMGINPNRINMLTFGLGSGIAGIAGVAIGLFAQVTSEVGSNYIVQSFMTVVVGGVGNIWGALAGASLIGILQKGIEWFNLSNTLAAQTYMIIFIIIFIQFRPRGIIALRGRVAGDCHDRKATPLSASQPTLGVAVHCDTRRLHPIRAHRL